MTRRTKRTKKEILGAALQKLLQQFQYKLWIYDQEVGEFWPGLLDGEFAMPNKRQLASCRVVPDRFDIIRALPKGGVFAEVGTLHGDFIVRVLDIYEPSEIHIFDNDFNNLRPKNRDKLAKFGKVTFHEGDSSTKLSEFAAKAGAYCDVVYVDADHTYEGVWKDLEASLPLLKQAGYLVCNDYTTWDHLSGMPYGVYWAVNRFAEERDLTFEYLALEVCGYHDVALRRPQR